MTIDKWIPALRADGRRELFSLHDLFAQAHELRDLAVKPHERIAIMRLLLCITQAALDGPGDESDWENCQPLIQPRVRDYLVRWQAAFELFGDGPRFLQVPNLQPANELDEGNAATKLDLTLATGNNSILFDNSAANPRAIGAARVALNLLTFQSFSPCGTIGVALWSGKPTLGWMKYPKPAPGQSNHAPCAPSSVLHTYIVGLNLLKTLWRNTLTTDTVLYSYGPKKWGKPVWELPVNNLNDGEAVQNATMTYLGRLTPLSRPMRLNADGVTLILANGLDYPVFPAFREATATIVVRKDKTALLAGSTSRSLWRQLPAITVTRRAKAVEQSGPLSLQLGSRNCASTIWVGALITEGNGKMEDVVEASYSLPAGMFSEFGRAAYEKGVDYAEKWEGALIQSVKAYASSLKVASPAYDHARQQFWTRVEQHVSALFDLARNTDLAADLSNCPWGTAVQRAAFDAYEQSCARQSPRQIEAYALGLRKFTFRSKNPPPTPVAHE